MKAKPETSSIELRQPTPTRGNAPSMAAFFTTTGPLPAGLGATVATNTTSSEPMIRVFTGSLLAKRYLPVRTNTPVQVQATYTVTGDKPSAVKFSAQYEFGPRVELDAGLLAAIRAEVDEFVIAIVASAPSFPDLWDEAAATISTRVAEDRTQRLTRQTREVAEAIAVELAADGAVTADPDTLVNDPRIAEAVADWVATPPPASGNEVARQALRRLHADALARIADGTRLSEMEFIALAVEQTLAENPDLDPTVVRAVVSTTYNAFYGVNYGTGFFPDRAPGDDSRC